jgi:hypothetical protein
MSSSTSGSGLAARETRLARALARAVGAEAKLYAVVCAHDVAKARCLGRNAENGWNFLIDEAAFEALRVKFQPVEPDRRSTWSTRPAGALSQPVGAGPPPPNPWHPSGMRPYPALRKLFS